MIRELLREFGTRVIYNTGYAAVAILILDHYAPLVQR